MAPRKVALQTSLLPLIVRSRVSVANSSSNVSNNETNTGIKDTRISNRPQDLDIKHTTDAEAIKQRQRDELQGKLSLLLSGIAAGDRKDFEKFFNLTRSRLQAFVFQLGVRDQELAEDLLQDIYLTVWKKASYFNEQKGKPSSWLAVIARNKVYDLWRRLGRRQEHGVEENVLENIKPSEGHKPAHPEGVIEDRNQLEIAMRQLKDEEQELVRLVYHVGHSLQECADQLEQPLGTIKWRLHQIHKKLAKLCTEGK